MGGAAMPLSSSRIKHLQSLFSGIIHTDNTSLTRCSTDMSIYRIPPLAVAAPASMEDLFHLVSFAANEGIPLTARGGGSGTAGSALGSGIVVTFDSQDFLKNIVDFNIRNDTAYVTVESGVRHQDLQIYLKKRGYYLPADPSSAPICRIGGNIATKASGPHGLSHGAIDRFMEHIEFISADGQYVNTAVPPSIPDKISDGILKLTDRLKNSQQAVSLLNRRKKMKTASGYNLFPLLENLPSGTTLARLFAGSVGTLGLVTRAVLRCEPLVAEKSCMMLFFNKLTDLGKATETARNSPATAIELISRDTVRILKKRLGAEKIPFADAHLLFIEFEGDESQDQSAALLKQLHRDHLHYSAPPSQAQSKTEADRIMGIRKQILPVLMRPGHNLKALSIVNDVGVMPEYLPGFIEDLESFFTSQGLETIIYGHAGNGNLHLRPLIDISSPGLKQRIQTIADGVYQIVFRYQGTITAEHGMGRLRAPYLEREWGAEIFSSMQQLKTVFDPRNIFNPDGMFCKDPITDNLREELHIIQT